LPTPRPPGAKRSLAVEGAGIPLGVIAAPANRRDDGLLAATREVPAAIQVGRRLVERSHAWLNAFGKLRWCTERRQACVVFWLALACVVVIIRRLVRGAWTKYRCGDRPSAFHDHAPTAQIQGGRSCRPVR